MKFLHDYAKERLQLKNRQKNQLQHTVGIFTRALLRAGCRVEKGNFSYEVTCPQGGQFTFSVVSVGRTDGQMLKMFYRGREYYSSEKPFFSWVNHGKHRDGTPRFPEQLTPKRASVLLVKKIRMNPLYNVHEA